MNTLHTTTLSTPIAPKQSPIRRHTPPLSHICQPFHQFLNNNSSKHGKLTIKPTKIAASTPSTASDDDVPTTKPFSVLFVCLGNICRSPAAEGVFRHLVKKRGLDSYFYIDSAGTINYHEVSKSSRHITNFLCSLGKLGFVCGCCSEAFEYRTCS